MYQEDSFKTSQVVYAHTRSDEADMEYKMHCHNSYEIYYMVKGNVEYFLEGTSYVPKPGSLLIIPPNCFHGLRVLDGSEYHRIRLHFVPELLTEKEKQLLLGILGKSWWYMEEQFRAEWYFNSLEECGSYSRELQDIAIRARIVSFLTYLSAMYEKAVGHLKNRRSDFDCYLKNNAYSRHRLQAQIPNNNATKHYAYGYRCIYRQLRSGSFR